MSTIRTFIAIPATDEVYANALSAIAQLKPLAENISWVVPDNLHWTLQFLGEVTDVDLYGVCRDVKRAAAEFQPFTLCAGKINAFPNLEKPRTVWLGSDSQTLCQLQDRVEQRMAQLGFRPERQRYTPHLTLGRVQQGSHGGAALSERLATLTEFDGGQMEVDEVIVYGSEMSREGPTYHVVGRAPLAQG